VSVFAGTTRFLLRKSYSTLFIVNW